jgi:4-alpha-glucanotransferase
MKLVFNIEYYTEFGQNVYITGNIPELGSWDENLALKLTFIDNGRWKLEVFVEDDNLENLEYKYFLKDSRNNNTFNEWDQNRIYPFKRKNFFSYIFYDSWKSGSDLENPLYSSAFTGNLWRRKSAKSKKVSAHFNHALQLLAPRIDSDHVFCLSGDDKNLGNWDSDQVILMDGSQYPLWKADVFLENNSGKLNYKYGIYNTKKRKFVGFEDGLNRILDHKVSVLENGLLIKTDINYRYPDGLWKGAGVAIPVFSLRTENSYGVGEFMDLKVLVDWAVKAGLKLVQILPINDTVANHTWKDSYPYAAISVFALHPVYLNLIEMGKLSDKKQMDFYRKEGRKLNKLDTFNYVSVMDLKSKYYKHLYDQDKKEFQGDKKFKRFFKENKDWLIPYAVFSCLRDRFGTPDFTKWKTQSRYDEKEIQKLVKPSNHDYDDFAVHYFIQYHLHLQLSKVVEYARSKGVILKGDLPIGIYRDSVDAWVEPELYHMNKQAGAPPDAYSITGQNWRFPTYNWAKMAEDNYAWWRRRLSQMAKYFDRFCKPVIREYMLDELFGELQDEIRNNFLNDLGNGNYQLKDQFNTQRKVENFFIDHKMDDEEKTDAIKFGLYTLIGNVLFFEEPGSNGTAFHPKIAYHSTYTYQELDDHTKNVLNDIYTHYYYNRQENFWREQAMVKLPAINKASDMLVCGEDLGMVPDCVPGVMYELGILRLYIQRMPKETDSEFGHPADAPYLSVASPSCHDMSTVRGWWEEDHERTQRFYNQMLGHDGEAPQLCDVWISEEVLQQHLFSSAMWTIFPIQDLMAIDDKLKRKDPDTERINDPSNPDNLWQYRLHMNLEDLVKEKDFNNRLLELVQTAGRANSF